MISSFFYLPIASNISLIILHATAVDTPFASYGGHSSFTSVSYTHLSWRKPEEAVTAFFNFLPLTFLCSSDIITVMSANCRGLFSERMYYIFMEDSSDSDSEHHNCVKMNINTKRRYSPVSYTHLSMEKSPRITTSSLGLTLWFHFWIIYSFISSASANPLWSIFSLRLRWKKWQSAI